MGSVSRGVTWAVRESRGGSHGQCEMVQGVHISSVRGSKRVTWAVRVGPWVSHGQCRWVNCSIRVASMVSVGELRLTCYIIVGEI